MQYFFVSQELEDYLVSLRFSCHTQHYRFSIEHEHYFVALIVVEIK